MQARSNALAFEVCVRRVVARLIPATRRLSPLNVGRYPSTANISIRRKIQSSNS